MISYSTKEIINWLNPWPIDLKNRRHKRWQLRIESLDEAGDYYRWFAKGQEKITIHDLAIRLKRAIDKELPDPTGGRGHYIEMLAKYHIPALQNLTIVVDRKYGFWRVIDGNHHLIACFLARMQKRPLPIKSVGVVREV